MQVAPAVPELNIPEVDWANPSTYRDAAKAATKAVIGSGVAAATGAAVVLL
jgi:hypothetical protein